MARAKRKTPDVGVTLRKRASNARSSWLSRCRDKNWPAEAIPTRLDIQSWLEVKFQAGTSFCVYSGSVLLPDDDWQFDHWNPLDRGGSPALSNIVLSTKRMNQAKGNMPGAKFVELLLLTDNWPTIDKKQLIQRLIASSRIYG